MDMLDGEAVAADDVKLEYREKDEINRDDEVEEEERVCSLCGDIGFKKSLVLCNKCGFRFQHLYCSRVYPEIDMKKWSCEWCIHEQQTAVGVAAAPVDEYEFRRNKKRRRQRSNSKVFEFLLEIADESSPEAERSISKQENLKSSSVCGKDDDIENEKMVKRSSSSWLSFGLESAISSSSSSSSCREKSSVAGNGRFHRAAVTKKKSKSRKAALDGWRNIAVNKNKLGCRRYKLLADVHC